jgi:predicted transposase YbfD/YdcC
MSTNPIAEGLLRHFEDVPDPRSAKGVRHSLRTILTISFVATICGADEWTEIEQFGKEKLRLFQDTFGVAQRGVPSHDTFGRLFAILEPKAFQECFLAWVKSITDIGGQISIDGKTMRGSFDTFNERLSQHVVSAYGNDSGLVLAQTATAEKSNEITAIPKLLSLLDLKECLVTIDAIGTQVAIAQQIVDSKGDYLLAVKGNQGSLYEEIAENFEKVGVQDDSYEIEEINKDHGRLEQRHYTSCPAQDYLTPGQLRKWPGLKTIVMTDNYTDFVTGKKAEQSRGRERRFFITTLEASEIEKIKTGIRNHWAIENSLHYILDVAFGEDYNRTRKGNAAVNQNLVRQYALNLLKKETSAKVGIKTKRKRAGWSDEYLFKILAG